MNLRTLLLGPLLLTAAVAAAQASDDDLRALAEAGMERAASRWGVSPTLRFSTGESRMRSLEDGRVDVPLPTLRSAVADMSEADKRLVVDWLMAHEAWHQHQYRRGWRQQGATLPDRRLRECEADVMAGYAVLDADLAERISEPDEQTATALAASLNQVLGLAERLETGAFGTGTHPDGEQRRSAIRTGIGRAVQERLVSLSSAPERLVVSDRMAAVYEIRTGEDRGNWAERYCRNVLHQGDGVASLALGTPRIAWSRSADAPFVEFSLPYRNAGTVPIRVSMQVRTVSVPRSAPEDRGRWIVSDQRTYRFDLQPGGTHSVAGQLTWYATDDVYPKLLFAPDRHAYFDATRLAALHSGPLPARVGELEPALQELRNSLSTIYNAAPDRFELVSRNCGIERGTRTCMLTLAVPGIREAEVSVESNGSASVELTLYEGGDAGEAAAAYSRFRSALRVIYPALAFRESSRGENRDQLSISPAPTANLMLVKRPRSSSGYRVTATITPVMF